MGHGNSDEHEAITLTESDASVCMFAYYCMQVPEFIEENAIQYEQGISNNWILMEQSVPCQSSFNLYLSV